MSWDFARPWALGLLLVLPLYALWVARRRSVGLPYPAAGSLLPFATEREQLLELLPEILRALCFGFLTIALAGPRVASAATEVRGEGVPIAVALDISSSMLAEDLGEANRLAVARQTVARFIGGREDDPIALVPFAGEAITQVPLTLDGRVLLAALDNLRVGLLQDGTAIGSALAVATNRLRRAPGESGVIILLSDGASNRGEVEPLEAARAAAAYGIRIFTIGVGSEGAARIPIPRGTDTAYAELAAGLDEPLLRRIAELTGGAFFRATDAAALRRIFATLDRIVPTPVEEVRRTRYTDRHLPFLLLGAIILLAEWALRGSRWGRMP